MCNHTEEQIVDVHVLQVWETMEVSMATTVQKGEDVEAVMLSIDIER